MFYPERQRTLTALDFGLRARAPAPAPREPVAVVAITGTWLADGAPAEPGRRYQIEASVAAQLVARGKAQWA